MKKMEYLILMGIAYQQKQLLNESMECYDKSLFINDKFNYFALLQKAEIYKSKGDIKNESENLKNAITCIENLKNAVEEESISANEISRYKIFDHYIGYNIYHEELVLLFRGNSAQQKKIFLACLDKRIIAARILLQSERK